MRQLHKLFGLLLALTFPSLSGAVSVTLTLADLDREIDHAMRSGDGLGLLVGRDVQALLDQAGLQLDEAHLTASGQAGHTRLRGGCSARIDLESLTARVRLNPQTGFEVVLDALSKPIVASIDVFGELDLSGRLQAYYGARILGRCVRYQDDSFTATLNSEVSLSLVMRIFLDPVLVDERTLRISPRVELEGSIQRVSNDVRIRGVDWLFGQALSAGRLNQILGLALEGAINDTANAGTLGSQLSARLAAQQAALNAEITAALGGGSRDYRLPVLAPRHHAALANLVNSARLARFPIAADYVERNAPRLLVSLVLGDADALRQLLGSALACEASRGALVEMPRVPLYTLGAGACVPLGEYPTAAGYFADSRCLRPVDYEPESFADYCAEVADPDHSLLGNALPWSMGELGVERPWTTSPGSRFDLGVRSIRANRQPYVKRVAYRNAIGDGVGLSLPDASLATPEYAAWLEYRQDQFRCSSNMLSCTVPRPSFPEPDVSTLTPFERGQRTCGLEMRIYKRDIAATGLKPLMAVHGGGWKFRGFAFQALESQISHYTERGFVVFAPFYRLSSDADAPEHCAASLAQMTADIAAALDWVRANASRFGADGAAPVALLGQSAGAHLATWLSLNRPFEVDRALLLYPPADLGRLVDAVQAGAYTNPVGLDMLSELLDQDVVSLDRFNPVVFEHSLAAQLASDPVLYPDFYVLHGARDELVPLDQARALCNARGGDSESGPADGLASGLSQVVNCGGESRLAVFGEAAHALDLCVEGIECPAGSEASRAAVARGIRSAAYWLSGRFDPVGLVPVISSLVY